jgi:hypothetical protein
VRHRVKLTVNPVGLLGFTLVIVAYFRKDWYLMAVGAVFALAPTI